MSLALTRDVNVTWLSEQTGVALATLREHYGLFVHTYDAGRFELEKIEGKKWPFGPPIALETQESYVSFRNLVREGTFPTGFRTYLAGVITMEFRRAA